MKRTTRRLFALLSALMMLWAMLPAYAFSAVSYNAHDVEKLLAFFAQTNNMGTSNGTAILGTDFNPDDPSSWTCCLWDDNGRLTAVSFSSSNAVGMLDLSGCTELYYVSSYWCKLTGFDISGCHKLETIELDNNQITSIDVSGCPLLEVLWLANNKLVTLDVSNNPLLRRLDCGTNQLTELNVSNCPELTYLDCGNNSLTELDLSSCTKLYELIVKNNLLEELDISGCTELERLRALGNRLKKLDLSVMNGGEEYMLRASGDGYVGTKCTINSTGAHIYATVNTVTGAAFYGWYKDGVLLQESKDMLCEFGAGPAQYTALFEGAKHELTVNYVFEDGSEAAPAYHAELDMGMSYSVPSPKVDGYYTETLKVEGVMGDDDMVYTVVYLPIPGDLLMGDIDDNGVINSLDALYLLRYTLNVMEPTAHMLLAGDMDGNGIINANDVLIIVRISLELI